MKKILSLAFMLGAFASIHATVTAVVAPCEGVANKVFMYEASAEEIQQAQDELREKCKGR